MATCSRREIENLSVLTSGPIPPNPSELLGRTGWPGWSSSWLEMADMVIFDSPPVLAVTDAAVLGRQVDGVVLVVDAAGRGSRRWRRRWRSCRRQATTCWGSR